MRTALIVLVLVASAGCRDGARDAAAPARAGDGDVEGQGRPPDDVLSSRHVEVDVDRQVLVAWEGSRKVWQASVSTGRRGKTPTGRFRIWRKHRRRDMKVGLVVTGDYFVLEDVPWIMWFAGEDLPRQRGFAIHGTHWHQDFGEPVSHGCINMSVGDAKRLFYWTAPWIEKDEVEVSGEGGTPVEIHGWSREEGGDGQMGVSS